MHNKAHHPPPFSCWDVNPLRGSPPVCFALWHTRKNYREKVVKLEIKELMSEKFDGQSKGVVILPHNYLSEDKEGISLYDIVIL